ncbi:MAG TPA: imidazolonepropionase [Ignavibacteriaceae bacterium]|nr:imidazolonepropionase [Ignavibacteriaceae bacterium]
MLKLLSNPSQIITVDTNKKNVKRANELKELSVLTNHSILIENNIIKDFIPEASVSKINPDVIIDLAGKIVLPGIIECHTHTAFAGSRAKEFRQRLAGVHYEEIAKAGGGINTTVSAVRQSSFEELIDIIKPRIENFISQGITTLEIKSGYGLDLENELKLLKAINYLNEYYPIDIIPTFLGAHTFPLEFKDDHQGYVDLIIEKMLPKVAEKKYAVFCDGFCESTAFSENEIDHIFTAANKLGLKLKLHTEQFNSIGGIDIALKHNATSIDHLEVLNDSDISKVCNSDTVAVLLPGVSFFLNYGYAPARKLIDGGAIVTLATDYNPGSSYISNIAFIMSLAALKMNMTIEETISAVTINSAKALELQSDRGSLEIGKKADFAIFNTNEYSDIVYNVGKNLNCMTIKNGEIIFEFNGGKN